MKRKLALIGALFLACGATGSYANAAAPEPQGVHAAAGIVTGTVTDDKGEPVIGASVSEIGTTRGTMTDVNGRFSLKTTGKGKLKISYIGYKPLILNPGDDTNVKLVPDNQLLGDVVVVGYGQQKKANLTGAVSSVDVDKTLVGRQIPDVGRGLQGTTPGLSVTIPNGEVGSDPTIKIRGQVASYTGSSKPLILLDNVEIPSIQIVNPEDIASISVLKDAAASSIYGSKAAFGVILITTKKGSKTDNVDVSYSGNFAWENISKKMNMAGVDGIAYRVDALKRAGGTVYGAFWFVNEESLEKAREWQATYGGKIGKNDPFVYGRDWYLDNNKYRFSKRIFDPYDYMIREWTPSMSHNFSVNGRSGRTSYSIGLGYLDQNGLIRPAKHDDFRRYNASARISTDINKYWTMRAGFNYSMRNKRYAYATSSTTADPWLYLYRWDTTYPMGKDEWGRDIRSPYNEMKNANTANKQDTYLSVSLGTTLNITKDWHVNVDYTYAAEDEVWNKVGTKFTMDNSWAGGSAYVARLDAEGNQIYVNDAGEVVPAGTPGAYAAWDMPYMQYTGNGANPDHIYRSTINAKRHTWNITTDYNWDINDINNVKLMLGMNCVDWESESNWSQVTNLTDILHPSFSKTCGTQTAGGSKDWDGQLGWFGRVNYALMQRYLLEFNLRHDATSKFPKDLRWRWFPSFSMGWRIGDEAFMRWAKPVLTSWKLRGSYGKIGDQSVSNSLYIATMDQGQLNWIQNGSKLTYVGTPSSVYGDITWQDIETLDLGTDISLWDGRIGVIFDWYQRDTKNMLVPQEGIPETFGAASPMGNFGNIRTRGWEVEVNFNHRFANGLGLNAMVTVSDAKSKITKYGSGRDIDGWYNGKTYGEIWGYETDRLYQKSDFVYDENGNIVTTYAYHGKETTLAEHPDARLVNKLSDPNGVYQDRLESGKFHFGPGDVKYKDLDGNGDIWYGDNTVEKHGDKKVIGNSTPRYEYGFRLGADWYGVDFSIFFQGVGSRKIWGSGFLAIPGYNCGDGAMPQAIAGDYWTENNTGAFYPAAWNMGGSDTGFNLQKQSRYLLNMAYLRCKNITLGYTLPASITKKAYISKARFYVAAENLFTHDNLRGLPIDPEVVSGVSMFNSGNYNSGRTGVGTPAMKNISVGIQLNF